MSAQRACSWHYVQIVHFHAKCRSNAHHAHSLMCTRGAECGRLHFNVHSQWHTVGIAEERIAAADNAGVDCLHHEWHCPCMRQLIICRAPVVTLVGPPANFQAHIQSALSEGLATKALTTRDRHIRQVTLAFQPQNITHFHWTKQGDKTLKF